VTIVGAHVEDTPCAAPMPQPEQTKTSSKINTMPARAAIGAQVRSPRIPGAVEVGAWRPLSMRVESQGATGVGLQGMQRIDSKQAISRRLLSTRQVAGVERYPSRYRFSRHASGLRRRA